MDPITALGAAAAVLQLIQFGGSIILKARQIHHFTGHIVPEYLDCEATTQRVSQLAENLKKSLGKLQASHGALGVLSIAEQEEIAEAQAIEKICVKCLDFSDTLLGQLRKLQLQENESRRKWKSFRMALKSVWSKGEINSVA